MSPIQISLSPDLKRLREDGYEVAVGGGYLVIDHVPYVNTERQVHFGQVVSSLTVSGDRTAPPDTHVVMFAGSHPCHANGSPLDQIIAGTGRQELGDDLAIDFMFSSKPASGAYPDYYEKMTTYINILGGPAQAIDSGATARTFAVIETSPEESVFHYVDTATSRAGIGVANTKLQLPRVAIVGLGGTGSYVLDHVAKNPVREIHVFDGDIFYSHNAFRAPGAPSLGELRGAPTKVSRFSSIYGQMHRGIVEHEYAITAENVGELAEMSFVFLCMDGGDSKQAIVKRLHQLEVPFVDVGMGVYEVDGAIGGVVRVTASGLGETDHQVQNGRIPFDAGAAANDYARNIQISELNALNAAFAVIRWKKIFGFYVDFEHERFSAYTIDGNHLLNEDQA